MRASIQRTRFVAGGLLLAAAGLVATVLNGSGLWHSSGETPHEGAALVASPPEAVIDGDSRKPGASRVSFTITNRGSRTIRIVSVETTCGCTVADAHSGAHLTPKASTTLAVSATPPQFGDKETYVIVNTDDPAAPQLRIKLTLRGQDVKPPYITVAPTELRLQTSRPGEILSRGFEVRTVERRDAAPWLSRDQSVPDGLKAFWVEPPVEIKYMDEDVFRVYYLHVEITAPKSSDEPFRAFIELKGSTPASRPGGLIPVIASLVPRIQTHPRELFFSIPDSGPLPVDRTIVFLETERTESLKISVEDSPADWIETGEPECVAAPSSISVRMRIRLKAVPPRPTDGSVLQRTVIRVRTSDPIQPLIELPVTARFN